MKYILRYAIAVLIFGFTACTSTRLFSKDDKKIDITFVQVNDVYEIAPLSGGKEGGMARVATLKKQESQKNSNTYLVMAGDFLSPSVYNSLPYEGKAIRGRQMIEVMNAAGMNMAVFGNHEFDIKETELEDRINESGFQWVSSNTFHKIKNNIEPFKKNGVFIPETYILNVRDADGTTAKIGFIGLTLPFNKADYVSYTNAFTVAQKLYKALKDSVDGVVAITHQSIEEDKRLADEVPGLAVILGGHEHDMRFVKEGNIYITKAHSNARSAFVVNIKLNKKKRKISVNPQLIYLNETIAPDSATTAVVQKWTDIAEKNYASLGFEASKIILRSSAPLDGREKEIRSHPTNLTRLLMSALAEAVPSADVVFVNSGSIRVDDVLQMPVTEYDIIRTLPFGGGIREADMKGSLLLKTLDQGKNNIGTGGYLLYNEAVINSNGVWKVKGEVIDPLKIYHVAMSDFLFTGKEANLDFLNPKNESIVKIYDAVTSASDSRSDIRLALIRYLENKK